MAKLLKDLHCLNASMTALINTANACFLLLKYCYENVGPTKATGEGVKNILVGPIMGWCLESGLEY